MRWPDDYRPAQGAEASPAQWEQTIADFRDDVHALCRLVEDPATDLGRVTPPGNSNTVRREIMVAGDHNACHIGELAIMRQAMGTRPARRQEPVASDAGA